MPESVDDDRSSVAHTDWASTPFGEKSSWPPHLRGTYEVILHTRFPVVLFWGPELRLVYNDAYIELILDKHPHALGAPAAEVFAEAWPQLDPLFEQVRTTRQALQETDGLVPLVRRGFLEDCWFSFSYSPVIGTDGEVLGVLDIATETTRQVLAERRLSILTTLLESLAPAETRADVVTTAMRVLRADDAVDLAAVDLVLSGPEAAGAPVGPSRPQDAALRESWAEMARTGRVEQLTTKRTRLGTQLASATTTDGTVLAWGLLEPDSPSPSAIVFQLVSTLRPDDDYVEFLGAIASVLERTLSQTALREAERSRAASDREMSITMQRSLLDSPVPTSDVQVAARYLPSSQHAYVGGDWHDLYRDSSDALVISIGDISGHDSRAAAQMAQVRNMLRGLGWDSDQTPSAILERLDHVLDGLAPDVLATAVLGRMVVRDGRHELTWSNAGHPPPVLLDPDGVARLVDQDHDVMLGVLPGSPREDHTVVLEPGSTLVLYTDGLVERRDRGIDDGFETLLRTVAGHQHDDPDRIADLLLEAALSRAGDTDDDIAVLVVRCT